MVTISICNTGWRWNIIENTPKRLKLTVMEGSSRPIRSEHLFESYLTSTVETVYRFLRFASYCAAVAPGIDLNYFNNLADGLNRSHFGKILKDSLRMIFATEPSCCKSDRSKTTWAVKNEIGRSRFTENGWSKAWMWTVIKKSTFIKAVHFLKGPPTFETFLSTQYEETFRILLTCGRSRTSVTVRGPMIVLKLKDN